jgi:hypothetical protein
MINAVCLYGLSREKCNTGASADAPVLLYIKIIFPLKMAKAKRRPFKIVPPRAFYTFFTLLPLHPGLERGILIE